MRIPFAWWWPALAGALTALAIFASRNYAVAVPAAAAAVIVAGLGVAEAVRRTATPRPPLPRWRAAPSSNVRSWLHAGKMGREDLVLMLDRLERLTLNPTLRARTAAERAEIVYLPPAEFRRYIARRLAALEGTA